MKKILLTLMLSGIIFASFAQDSTTTSNSSQPAQQETTVRNFNLQYQLGDLVDYQVTKEQILEQPYIKIVPEMEEPFKMEVTSFQVIFVHNGYEDTPIRCNGNQLSEQVKEKISELPAGTYVLISNVKVTSKACSRTLDDVYYKIVEKE